MPANTEIKKSAFSPIIIIGALFFIFGFITWVNSVLIPYLKIACQLSTLAAYLVTTAFYISYFVMAIPSGMVLKATGFKKGMSLGLIVMAVGALIFIPAAMTRTYWVFLLGLFIQGTGLTLLQTASNPYITILGPIESAAKRISIMGICNKVAGSIAPVIMGAIALKDADILEKSLKTMSEAEKAIKLNGLAERVIVPYIVIMVILLFLAFLINKADLPDINMDGDDDAETNVATDKKSILAFPHLILGVITLFLYVGAEVIAGDTIIQYGSFQGIAFKTAKFFTSCTLISMIVGYVIGIICIPKYFSQSFALKASAILGIIFTLIALYTHGYTSVLFIALLGLANSLVWPAIWPLAMAGLGRFTKIGASLLIMGIVGGAIMPLMYAALSEKYHSAQQGYWVLIPSYLCILFYAVKGHKIGLKK